MIEYTCLTLWDNEKNRDKSRYLNKLEIMADDRANETNFWNNVEDKIEWGKTYRITIEEVQ